VRNLRARRCDRDVRTAVSRDFTPSSWPVMVPDPVPIPYPNPRCDRAAPGTGTKYRLKMAGALFRVCQRPKQRNQLIGRSVRSCGGLLRVVDAVESIGRRIRPSLPPLPAPSSSLPHRDRSSRNLATPRDPRRSPLTTLTRLTGKKSQRERDRTIHGYAEIYRQSEKE